MKVAELEGAMLDAWAARAEGYSVVPAPSDPQGCWVEDGGDPFPYCPSTDWRQGGELIERENIALLDPTFFGNGPWKAFIGAFLDVADQEIVGMEGNGAGPTPLIAAMRAYVASKFGDEVPEHW